MRSNELPVPGLLERLQQMARLLRPLRPALVVATGTFALLLLLSLLGRGLIEEAWTIPALLGLLWSILLHSFIIGFSTLPARSDPGDSLFMRFKRRLRRWAYGLLAVVTLAATAGIAFTSLRLLVIWLR